jgi:hypothetical protein
MFIQLHINKIFYSYGDSNSNLFYQIQNKYIPENAAEVSKKKNQVNEEDEKMRRKKSEMGIPAESIKSNRGSGFEKPQKKM